MTHIFKAVDICYAVNNKVILKNINFFFQTGQIICFLGNNGSGKSSLLKICAGITQSNCGNIILNDKNISHLSDKQRANFVAWLPQNLSRPYNMSFSEFMELSKHSNKLKSLKLFDVDAFQKKDIATLSGGEWKRCQLARLWETSCPVLLLDEPDGDLDLKYKRGLIQLCKDYVQKNNAIIFVVTHDIVFAREVADTVCALSEGRLVWNSNSHEFWNSKVINKIFSTKVF
ncbi:MAG: ABC transporter ATP-binding protein [Bdellovibrionota bacterium]